MVSRKLAIGFMVLLVLSGAPASAKAQTSADWLIGTWVLCEDPDNSPKESLQFNSDGSGQVIRAKGNIDFLYKRSGRSVSLLANANGYAIPIELSVSDKFDRLLLHSDKTGSTSSYVRIDSALATTCTIR
jgi:hypothetical protein